MTTNKIIKKIIIYTFFFTLIFSTVYFIKDNVEKQKEIKETIAFLFDNWHSQNMEGIYNISKTKAEDNIFQYKTGFEENEVISDIINKHIYEGPEYDLDRDIVIDGIGKKDAKASVTISMHTYNNLEVIDTVIETLLNDNSKITKDYQHDKFVESNEDSILKATQEVEKTSQKKMIIYMECEDNEWTIPYQNNKNFYDAMSGGMITFSESVNTEVDI